MSKHTPGPWTTDSDGDGKAFAIVTSTHIEGGPDDDVCEVYGGNTDDEATRKANATLIAAAPKLLAACKNATGACECNCGEKCDGTCSRAVLENAIAEAEGL